MDHLNIVTCFPVYNVNEVYFSDAKLIIYVKKENFYSTANNQTRAVGGEPNANFAKCLPHNQGY